MEENKAKVRVVVEIPGESPRSYEGIVATVLLTDENTTEGCNIISGATAKEVFSHLVSLEKVKRDAIKKCPPAGDLYALIGDEAVRSIDDEKEDANPTGGGRQLKEGGENGNERCNGTHHQHRRTCSLRSSYRAAHRHVA